MKVIQISAVTEHKYDASGNRAVPYEDATVYGLGDDNKLYYWGVTKNTLVNHKPDEDGNTEHYEKEHGWVESGK